MTHLYNSARLALAALAIAAPGFMLAGNIPQYKVSKGGPKYTEFSDGTAIPCQWTEGTKTIYPGGVETQNPRSAAGFPIGFDFRFGGRIFNQFVVSYTGNVYLGNDVVNYLGDAFRINMSPIKGGLKKATISYRTTGTEGNRVLEIQYKNAVLNEQSSYPGQYSLQIRLHEADGRVEMAFKEINTVANKLYGFDTSIAGWDTADQLGLYADGLDQPITVFTGRTPYMLDKDSYIHWDQDDYDMDYSPVFVFTPVSDTTAPSDAPSGLTFNQSGNTLNIEALKGANADATVILISESPFTDADMPKDGETFLAGSSCKFGNATALYYGNDDKINVKATGIESGKVYYVRAMSVNGYPAYGRDNALDKTYASSQAAPSSLRTQAHGENAIYVGCESEYPIIVAATTEAVPGYQKGYVGKFGRPSHDVKVGDELADGGRIIYVGKGSRFKYDAGLNELTYFRAWSVNGETVSAESIDALGIAAPSYPYEPGVENYPRGEQLEIWDATIGEFIPMQRDYDKQLALRAKTSGDKEILLSTPLLPLDRETRLTFEYAMETVAPPASSGDSGSIELPSGNKPGEFGETGYLSIKGDGETYKTVNTYSGTMAPGMVGGYSDGSSSFETVTVDLPAIGNDKVITFAFSTPESSTLFIRNIKIESIGEAPVTAPKSAPTELTADENRDAIISVSCRRAADAEKTAVLVSEAPFTDADMPQDGVELKPGQKVGNATVLYYGADENVQCATTLDILNPDYDTDYYFCAVAANGNPLYNREKVAYFTYHTLADAGAPVNLLASVNDEGLLNVTATRNPNAEGSIILYSLEAFNGMGDLVDGTVYKPGDTVGNATVIYQGGDEHIDATTAETVPVAEYVITGISVNKRGWFGDRTETFKITTVGIESVEIDEIDFAYAEIYNLVGIRINVSSVKELPAGMYIINGNKVIIK